MRVQLKGEHGPLFIDPTIVRTVETSGLAGHVVIGMTDGRIAIAVGDASEINTALVAGEAQATPKRDEVAFRRERQEALLALTLGPAK